MLDRKWIRPRDRHGDEIALWLAVKTVDVLIGRNVTISYWNCVFGVYVVVFISLKLFHDIAYCMQH